MKMRKLKMDIETGKGRTPLMYTPEPHKPTAAYLYFSANKGAETVEVTAAHLPGYNLPEPVAITSGKMIRVPIPPDVSRMFLINIPTHADMIRLINGIIDGEVLVDYAKYAIEYLVTTHGQAS